MSKQKLFKSTITAKLDRNCFSSNDKTLYILASDIEQAASKAVKEFRKWQSEDEERAGYVLNGVDLIAETVL